MRRIIRPAKHAKRRKLEKEALDGLRDLRARLDPEAVAKLREAFEQKPEPQTKPDKLTEQGEVRIDRARNVQFVMDFLNSPEGRHLRDKVLR